MSARSAGRRVAQPGDPWLVQDHRARVVLHHLPAPTAVLDATGHIVEVNRALCRLLGATPEELLGRTLGDLGDDQDREREWTLLARVLSGERHGFEVERSFATSGGDTVTTRITVVAVRDGDDVPAFLIAQVQDVTQVRLTEQLLAHRALHDTLTGLPNRMLGLDRIQQALDRSTRHRSRVAVLCCGIDRIRVVNDSIGPDHGDAVLVAVGRRLQDALRTSDTAARIGGDEFAVVCEGIETDREAILVAERLLAAVREPVTLAGHQVVPTLSIGIAISSPGQGDSVTLLRDAGTALHRAKENARGGWELVDEGLRRRARDRMEIEQSLRLGVARGELRLHLQPIVALRTGRTVGREALVRWEHPERGLLGPGWFLPVAEESGLIDDVGRWVLMEAAQAAMAEPELGYVAVNVSASQVHRASLMPDVEAALEHSGLPPQRLVVELTESVLFEADSSSRKELQRLDDLGVRLVVDDFGTGFSALSYLRDLPVSGIKVDRSFTAGLGLDPQCDRIVEALIRLADGLGVDVVAEGVETLEQQAALTVIGCAHAQGYLFGRPAPSDRRLILPDR